MLKKAGRGFRTGEPLQHRAQNRLLSSGSDPLAREITEGEAGCENFFSSLLDRPEWQASLAWRYHPLGVMKQVDQRRSKP